MKLEVTGAIPFPAARVLAALRDQLAALAEHMENIESIEVLEREDAPGRVRQRNRWQAARQSVPAALRPFVTPQMIAWIDEGQWDEAALCCRWHIEPLAFSRSFECAGTTEFRSAGEGQCTIAFLADAQIHLERIALIPAFLARRLQEPVERFIVKQLRPNFDATIAALRAYLAAQPQP